MGVVTKSKPAAGVPQATSQPRGFAETARVNERMLEPIIGRRTSLSEFLTPREEHLLRSLARNNFCDAETLSEMNGITLKSLGFLLYRIRCKFVVVGRQFAANFGTVIDKSATRPHLFSINPAVATVFGLEPSKTAPKFSDAFAGEDAKVLQGLATKDGLIASEIAELAKINPLSVSRYMDRLNARCHEFGWLDAVVAEAINQRLHRYVLNPAFAAIHDLECSERQNLNVYFTRRQRQVVLWLMRNPFSSSQEVNMVFGLHKQNVWREICIIREKCLELEKQFGRERNAQPFFMEISGTHLYGFSIEFCKLFGLKYVKPDPMKVLRSKRQRQVYSHLQAHHGERATDSSAALDIGLSDFINCRGIVRKKLVEAGLELKSTFVPPELRAVLINIRNKTGKWDHGSLRKCAEKQKRLTRWLDQYKTIEEAIRVVRDSLTPNDSQRIFESDLSALEDVGEDKFGFSWPDMEKACRYALLIRHASRADLLEILKRNMQPDIEQYIRQINECSRS